MILSYSDALKYGTDTIRKNVLAELRPNVHRMVDSGWLWCRASNSPVIDGWIEYIPEGDKPPVMHDVYCRCYGCQGPG